jgi:hypothetical protein
MGFPAFSATFALTVCTDFQLGLFLTNSAPFQVESVNWVKLCLDLFPSPPAPLDICLHFTRIRCAGLHVNFQKGQKGQIGLQCLNAPVQGKSMFGTAF